MGKNYNADLQKRVEDFISSQNLSQAKAAPLMGISQTALSQWRNSKYDNGNIEEVESKLNEFFKLQDDSNANKEKILAYKPTNGYLPTSISEDVYKVIRYCQLQKGMAIVHGDAGIGKTKGAERYIQDNPNNSIYIQATPSTGTLTNILKLLARALKISESHSKLDLMLEIKEKLEGTSKVIIIDEAQHLKLAALEEIRTLSDPNTITGESGTGICLIGNSEVYDRMRGKQEARFAQLFSRVKMNRFYTTSKVTKEDIEILFPALKDLKLQKEQDFLLGISQTKWGIRGAVNVYNNAVNNEDVSYNGLFGMAREMGIGGVLK